MRFDEQGNQIPTEPGWEISKSKIAGQKLPTVTIKKSKPVWARLHEASKENQK